MLLDRDISTQFQHRMGLPISPSPDHTYHDERVVNITGMPDQSDLARTMRQLADELADEFRQLLDANGIEHATAQARAHVRTLQGTGSFPDTTTIAVAADLLFTAA